MRPGSRHAALPAWRPVHARWTQGAAGLQDPAVRSSLRARSSLLVAAYRLAEPLRPGEPGELPPSACVQGAVR